MKFKVIRVNTETSEQIECYYPREDKEPVVGLADHIKYYFIEQKERPTDFDTNRYYLQAYQKLIEETMVCERGYELSEYSQEQTIERLKNRLSNYLDTQYLIPIRIKHAIELMGEPSEERRTYLLSLDNWINGCRDEYNRRVSEFINNNTFPSFDWDAKPE